MEYQYSSDMRWTNGVGEKHSIELDLDLAVVEILKSNKNIALRLKADEQRIREEVFTLVTEQILPKIIEDTGIDSRQPDGHMSIHAHSKIHSQAEIGIPTRQNTSLYIRDRMRMVFDITTSRAVNAIQALYANRGGVASDIANEIVKLLKKAVLNVHDRETHTSWSVSGNQLRSLNHKIEGSSADGN